jgi:tetratricopeptide (TPR) repeat protein
MKKYLILPICFLIFFLILSGCGKGSIDIYLSKGKNYYHKKNYQMAIRFFEKTLEVDSSNMDAKYYRALCYYGLGHNHRACEEISILGKNGYAGADSTLKSMGCFYFPEDTIHKEEKK